jgi:hypothetical protein
MGRREIPSTDSDIDHGQIDFPTDKLTIGQLRRQKIGLSFDDQIPEVDILETMAVEQCLARKAFLLAHGRRDEQAEVRQDLLRMLQKDYAKLGISSSFAETQQLVRIFEQAAVTQARAKSPKSR